ncbi:MAG: bifunctional proline dehydrogenase/L-glutamate gamma-semialdehyde dehydrogenase, partial [Steroidobacteraceae bacterium]|nr:bifunctional proline dehydrogenase/L-glutamate gamma-semialdehyde dehydrogenase [Deltaproteobacteria bacterium]
MQPPELNAKIMARGRTLFSAISGETPALFNTSTWAGRLMEWSMRDEQFKISLFRFVDVFPSLKSSRQLTDHIREYFGDEQDMPPVLSSGARLAGLLGPLGGRLLSSFVSANIHEIARQFIIGENTREAVGQLKKLRQERFAAVVDVLGEATLSADEAETYVGTCLELLDVLNDEQRHWSALPSQGADPELDWGHAPRVNIAVKPTALYCLANPMDFEGSVLAILKELRRICTKVVALKGFLCIDMESCRFREITLEVYRRLKLEYRAYPNIGIVLQAYLKETDRDLADLLEWARAEKTAISVRLVKGAYWDYEIVRAGQMGWPIPVWTIKAETDAAFERQARLILENHPICHLACATHNIRSIAAVIEMAAQLQVPASRYEFQMLYGMAEPVRKVLLRETGRVRLYCPYGELVPGMGYLVRRLLENTSNESFLRLTHTGDAAIEQLLRDPAVVAERERSGLANVPEQEPQDYAGLTRFKNEPAADFSRAYQRNAFPAAIAGVRGQFGRIWPLYIGGREVRTVNLIASVNPARPSEVLGNICQAGISEVDSAVAAALAAFPAWRDTAAGERAACLLKAAGIVRRRIFELASWQVLEIGKQWDQAHGDVCEAIDFLEFYARESIRYGTPRRLGTAPGELNQCFYEPKGVAAVIAPWNFPLAISMGMVSAAIVTGNPVVYKPSNLTAITGHQLVEIFCEAGLPEGVFNYLPGAGSVIGDHLVEHEDIALIAFTGSLEVGRRIIERAARPRPGQSHIKKVVCEMGGKNAIIIDDDADLDEAIPQLLNSAFGFQGQKCSACSRVIVLDGIHDRFVRRLVNAARAWRLGPAEDPSFAMGAVAEAAARQKILDYIDLGRREGTLLYQSPVPQGEGHWVPLTIIGGIRPEHRLAREEVFGPLLAVMRARDFEQALEWANSTDFALTGGVFSRSPEHLARARRDFRVGNLYLNRGITGALVERQPFGGAGLSGSGTKAGGGDYLLHFM